MSSHRVGVDLKFCWGEISLKGFCAPAGFEITPHKMCMDEVSSVGCFKHVCHLDNCCFVDSYFLIVELNIQLCCTVHSRSDGEGTGNDLKIRLFYKIQHTDPAHASTKHG